MNILAIGAHPDDLEIGCFGTLIKHKNSGDNIFGLILTRGERGGNPSKRMDEALKSSQIIHMKLEFGDFKDGFVQNYIEVISCIEKIVVSKKIDIIYCPSIHERHQDHRNTGLCVLVAGRKSVEVYAFETISCTNDFNPTMFVDITSNMDTKISCLENHKSQEHKLYIQNHGVFNRYRALKVDKPDRFFEAFEVIKLIK